MKGTRAARPTLSKFTDEAIEEASSGPADADGIPFEPVGDEADLVRDAPEFARLRKLHHQIEATYGTARPNGRPDPGEPAPPADDGLESVRRQRNDSS